MFARRFGYLPIRIVDDKVQIQISTDDQVNGESIMGKLLELFL